MITLNCSSRASALDSVSKVFGIDPRRLQAFLTNLDLEAICKSNNYVVESDDELQKSLETALACKARPIEKVVWFHVTRALPATSYASGIRPTIEIIEQLWSTIETIFASTKHLERLRRMKADGVDDFQYNHKAPSKDLSGPFGMLVRESAFRSKEMGNHDYLDLPEIVEDICNGYQRQYGEHIHDAVRAALKPTIVTFTSSGEGYSHTVTPALYYCYATLNNHRLTIGANTCFDGEGTPIAASRISNIEQLEQSEVDDLKQQLEVKDEWLGRS